MHAILPNPDSYPASRKDPIRSRILFVQIFVLSLEIVLTVLVLVGRAQIGDALGGHLALCALLLALVVIVEHIGYKSGELQKFTFLTAVAGPIGSAAALISEQLSSGRHSATLEQWYNTIAPPPAPAITLADRILDDQLVRPTSRLPQRFDRLLTHGTMREKQAFFAHIAADTTQPAMSDLLDTALRSRDQRVRVQAAAVASFIRDKARRAAGSAMPPVTALEAAERPTHHAAPGE
ncbi:hypothetical protein [Pelagibacterium sediminicola]|uniref:hypothetical protein n=1 Tax=Pelagibacterium sediminicola TaxID=2248761 RepID=UPI000E32456C|nr:hypothetical protein [Pelagibacterium sediminicola]